MKKQSQVRTPPTHIAHHTYVHNTHEPGTIPTVRLLSFRLLRLASFPMTQPTTRMKKKLVIVCGEFKIQKRNKNSLVQLQPVTQYRVYIHTIMDTSFLSPKISTLTLGTQLQPILIVTTPQAFSTLFCDTPLPPLTWQLLLDALINTSNTPTKW